MTKRLRTIGLVLFLLLCIVVSFPGSIAHADTPDVINSYEVMVTPQPDASLEMKYALNYTATTDFPSDGAFLEIGVPNKDFVIQEFGPKPFVTKAIAKTTGVSQVRLEFNHVPKKGENFKINFTTRQGSMAYALDNNATFRFTPGWFDFAEIKLLRIIWQLPRDATMIAKLSPPPTKQSDGQAIWEATNMAPNAKFTVEVHVAKKSFDNPKIIEAPPPPPAGQPTPGTPGGGDMFATIMFILLVIVLALIVIVVIAWFLDALSGGGGYSGGIGGYHGGSGDSIFGGGGGSGGSIFGGGGGGFNGGGGGSSGCACACACAGGGRAGCGKTTLGYDVSLLLETRRRRQMKVGPK